MSHTFHRSVAVLNTNGATLRHVPAELAKHMVDHGMAKVREARGRIRQIELSQPVSYYAERLGPPSEPSLGVRFYRWERLDGCARRIIVHHPRATYD